MILNLLNREASEIGYTIHNFPDGHKHIELHPGFNKQTYIDVVCRICNGDDLFLLEQVAYIINNSACICGNLYISYLLAARADRRFSLGEAYDLYIVREQIFHLGFSNITLLDVHSFRLWSLDRNIELMCKYAINNFNYRNYRICFPDDGARNRYQEQSLTEYTRKTGSIQCTKVRELGTNKLSGFEILDLNKWKSKNSGYPILVVDDLCDGGGTFIGISEKLRKELRPSELSLFVTHAIQKQGIEKVSKCYDKVFITNSYKNWSEEELPENVNVITLGQPWNI